MIIHIVPLYILLTFCRYWLTLSTMNHKKKDSLIIPLCPHLLFCIIIFLITACQSTPKEKLYPGTPSLLSGVHPEMNTPGFWIARHGDPDGRILDAQGIDRINGEVQAQGLTRDLGMIQQVTSEDLAKDFIKTITWVRKVSLFTKNGKRLHKDFTAACENEMNIQNLPPLISPRYGYTVRQTNVRILPTDEPGYEEKGSEFIDHIQASSIDWGTPLVLLHQSKSGEWLFVHTELVSGWIRTAEVAHIEADAFFTLYRRSEPLVVTAAKADLWADTSKTRFLGSVRMGSYLFAPIAISDAASASEGLLEIRMSARSKNGTFIEIPAWVESKDVSKGFLPYTARTIYEQSFKLLHTPYGWGGSFGERDCSQFLCEIFRTVGIVLPRNSSRQARVGIPIEWIERQTSTDAKKDILTNGAIGGATLLRFPGHIMLYLGSVYGEPYAIHSTWGYREKIGRSNVTRLVNRVVVSNLNLGDGSDKGSHIERLTNAVIIAATEAFYGNQE